MHGIHRKRVEFAFQRGIHEKGWNSRKRRGIHRGDGVEFMKQRGTGRRDLGDVGRLVVRVCPALLEGVQWLPSPPPLQRGPAAVFKLPPGGSVAAGSLPPQQQQCCQVLVLASASHPCHQRFHLRCGIFSPYRDKPSERSLAAVQYCCVRHSAPAAQQPFDLVEVEGLRANNGPSRNQSAASCRCCSCPWCPGDAWSRPIPPARYHAPLNRRDLVVSPL